MNRAQLVLSASSDADKPLADLRRGDGWFLRVSSACITSLRSTSAFPGSIAMFPLARRVFVECTKRAPALMFSDYLFPDDSLEVSFLLVLSLHALTHTHTHVKKVLRERMAVLLSIPVVSNEAVEHHAFTECLGPHSEGIEESSFFTTIHCFLFSL